MNIKLKTVEHDKWNRIPFSLFRFLGNFPVVGKILVMAQQNTPSFSYRYLAGIIIL